MSVPIGAGFPGIDGFLGTRASLMLDVVFAAMFLVIPTMVAAIAWVRYRGAYQGHKLLMLTLGSVLLVTVVIFEVDIRLNGWRERARPSPYYGTDTEPGLVFQVLYVHLCFAVTTAVLWIVVIARALRRFARPAAPGPHSRSHVFWARLAALDMLATTVTGWTFYWLAFVASAAAGSAG